METNIIYNKDCIEGMKELPDESVDLFIADPPYEMNEDDLMGLRDIIKKKIKKQGSIWIFARYKYVAEIKVLFSECFEFVNWIIWFKGTRGSSNNKFTNSHDDILLFTNSKKYVFNLDSIRKPYDNSAIEWYNKYGGVYDYKKVSRLNPKGKNPTDVWKINFLQGNSKEYLNHPHQKPLELIDRIVKVSSNENQIVVDCFSGSATVCESCKNNNRQFIGYEIDPQYYKLSLDRLSDKTPTSATPTLAEPKEFNKD